MMPANIALSRSFAVRVKTDLHLGLNRIRRILKMLRKFKVTYITVTQKQRTEEIEATSKYDAKQRFYRIHPKYEIIRVEEVPG
jgi:predicted site-specific integrase-resolvase